MVQDTPRDLIIGAYTNYDWDKIKYWVNSIELCGFKGDRAMIVYNSDPHTVQKLIDLNFKVIAFSRDQNGNFVFPQELVIVVQRFFNLWNFLDQFPDNYYRYVVCTDVKDVVFQTNPITWLENNLNEKKLVASSEGLLYRDEPWGDDNLQGSFPMVHQKIRNNPIWNCGVQAGTMQAMKDLWLQIWLTSRAGFRINADQAAYNLLLNSKVWSESTKFVTGADAWACQSGTVADPVKIDQFRPKLLEEEPLWQNGMTTTTSNIPHAILHQWDRIPNWINDIEKRYG